MCEQGIGEINENIHARHKQASTTAAATEKHELVLQPSTGCGVWDVLCGEKQDDSTLQKEKRQFLPMGVCVCVCACVYTHGCEEEGTES